MRLLSRLVFLAFGCCSHAMPQATTTQAAPAAPTQFYPFQIYPIYISTWSYIGCFTEDNRSRALDGPGLTNYTSMSLDLCGSFCASFWAQEQYTYFGVENGGECYCGSSLSWGANPISSGGCKDWCPVDNPQYRGEANSTCGGKDQGEIFSNHGVGPVYPSIIPYAGNYSYAGCYTDTTGSTLSGARMASFNMTLDTCAAFCLQWPTDNSQTLTYNIFGLQDGTECYCGNAIEPGTEYAADMECEAKTCSGNATEYCGGINRLSTYILPGTYVPW